MHKRVKEILDIIEGKWLGEEKGLEGEIFSLSTDTRKITPSSLFVPLKGERFDGHAFVEEALAKGAVASFWQEGLEIPPSLVGGPLILVADPLTALQKVASTYREEINPLVIAITGSNGKTTTKDLVTSLLKIKYRVHATTGNLNNHIGLPLTLLAMPEETEVAVVELGMNHFGELTQLSRIARPDIAVITNIGESHLEFLGSRQGIAEAKTEVLSAMNEEGILFFPADEPLIPATPLFQGFEGRKISCGFTEEAQVKGEITEDLGLEGFCLRLFFPPSIDGVEKMLGVPLEVRLPLPGRHLAQNALYALAIATHLGLTQSEIEKGLSSLTRAGMRMQINRGIKGMTIINDAYNASPTSMRAAFSFLAGLTGYDRKIVILGDMGELGPDAPMLHRELGRELAQYGFTHVLVTGTLAKEYEAGAKEQGYSQIELIPDREDLIRRAIVLAGPSTVMLLKASRFMRLEEIGNALLQKNEES